MTLSLLRRSLRLLVLALLLGVAPAGAQSPAPAPSPVPEEHPRIVTPPITFRATIAQLAADLVTLNANGAAIHIPSSQLDINVNGEPGAMNSLEVGDSVRMLLPSLSGKVQHIESGVMTVKTDKGPTVELPLAALPREVSGHQWVWARNPQGKMIRMNMNSALDLGATIVGPAAPGVTEEATGK